MKNNGRRVLVWAPRVMAILFALFISVFALDVFGVGYSFWETLAALFMHLIPTFLILIALAVAWRWALIGGILFLALGGWYILMAGDHFQWETIAFVAGPAVLIGILFLACWFTRSRAANVS